MWMSHMYLPLAADFFSIPVGFFVIVLILRSVRRRQRGRCIRPNSHPIPRATIAVVYG